MTLIAKPVVDRKYWILQQDNRKVGNVEACPGGYQVKINNQVEQFKTIKLLEKRTQIRFESIVKSQPKQTKPQEVYGYPTIGRVYNGLWNVQNKLPLYTKTSKSKSWYAAGWYQVKKGRNWKAVQDPKLILLQRYEYQGPYYSKEEAQKHD
jgi:alpha-N-acetylglucosamine transferase